MKIDAKFDYEFDFRKFRARVERKERNVLIATGAFVRREIQRSMRKAGKRGGSAHVSKPGSPPRYHTKLLRNLIFFDYDKRKNEVIVGPQKINTPSDRNRQILGASTVPELLEKGGTVIVSRINTKTKERYVQRLDYRPRPFIQPAVPKARKALADKMEKLKL